MNRTLALRTALLAGLVFLVPLVRTAEAAADDDDDKSVVVGKVRDIGTRHATPDIAPASDEAAQAIKRMKVPEGLQIKLWAAEPMLANPVAFNFDEKGRIFVAETYRYRTSVFDIRDYMWMLEDELACRTVEDRTALIKRNFGEAGVKELSIEGEILRLLEDTDGDGVGDKSYVYADGFNSPLDGIASGVLARRGKVYFTNIPSVWQFTGDKKAETRKEISRGYGVRFNFTGHDLHGLILGPDGKLYFSNGDRGAHARGSDGSLVDTPDNGAVYRCNPDGSELEVFHTGLRNPQSLVFNEYGDLFTGDNDCDHGDEERLVHLVWGGDSGWRVGYQFPPLGKDCPWFVSHLWWPRHAEQPAYIIPPICNIEDGPSGIEYYPGTGLNPSYAGNLFITHFKGAIARSGIYTYKLDQKGATYKIEDAKPFLTSALPTDVKFGPDGRLYTSDWADGWPKSKRGRIYAISDPQHERDSIIQETRALIGGDWTKRSNAELARLLGHADWRVRLEAQFTLAERGQPSVPVFAKIAADPKASALARRHAIWGLGQLTRTQTSALSPLRSLVHDSDAEVRAQVLKVLGDHHSASDAEAFVAALKDPSNRVKFFAAQGLARIQYTDGHPEMRTHGRTAALLAALGANNDEDNYLRHACVMGLVAGDDLAALKAAITDLSKPVRLGVLLALRRLHRPEVAQFLRDSDPYIVREAALAINDEPITAAYPALADMLTRGTKDEIVLFRAINAHFRLGQPENADAIASYAANKNAPAKARAEALAQLAEWPRPLQRDRLVGIYRPLPEKTRDRAVVVRAIEKIAPDLLTAGTPAVVQSAALAALQDLEVAGAAKTLFAVVSDENQSGETRAAALKALDKVKDPQLAEAVKLAGASKSSELRLAALPIASRLSPETAAPVLANLVSNGTVEERKTAYRALGLSKLPSANTLLAEQLRQLSAGKIPDAVQLELLSAAGRRNNPEIKQLLAAREKELADSSDPLASYRVALAGGDATRGRRIFENQPTLACIRCHRAGAGGGDAGPNLADAGAKYPREYLLESIVKPNAKIAPGFDTIVVTLKSGGSAAGIVARETANTLELRNTENKLVEVKKSDIAKREGAPSGMPEIYAAILTKTQLRDVVEYVASLKDKQVKLDESKPRALRGLPNPPKTADSQ